MRVVRAGAGFRVKLDAEHGPVAQCHAFQRAIVQADVRDLDVAGQRVNVHNIVVVLRGDPGLPAAQVFDRVIAAVMPEL